MTRQLVRSFTLQQRNYFRVGTWILKHFCRLISRSQHGVQRSAARDHGSCKLQSLHVDFPCGGMRAARAAPRHPAEPCAGDSAPSAHGWTIQTFLTPNRNKPTQPRQPRSLSTWPILANHALPRFLDSLQFIPATDWDALHDGQIRSSATPSSPAWNSTAACARTWGWQPRHFTLWEGDTLVGAIPGYLKTNSTVNSCLTILANAYARHGRDYYPKWLGAVPYSPVTGPRLLARHDSERTTLLSALRNALPVTGRVIGPYQLPRRSGRGAVRR